MEVDGEDEHGQSDLTGRPQVGGVFSGITIALGLGDGGRAPAPQFNSKLERDNYRLREENKRTKDELGKTQRTLDKYAIELQKTQYLAKSWYDKAKENEHETHRLRDQVQGLEGEVADVTKKYNDARSLLESGKFKVLEAFLHENVFTLILGLDALKEAVRTASGFLADNVVFRASEAFSEELEEARAVVVPLLGEPLAEILVTHGEKASTVGDGARGSRTLVRLASQVFLYSLMSLYPIQGSTKAYVVKIYASFFKIASWALPGAANRAAFSEVLEAVLEAEKHVQSSKDKLPRGMNVSLSIPLSEVGKEYDPLSMQAVDIDGQPIPDAVGTSEEVLGTLAFGLKKGTKIALLPQILLRSTLEGALEQEQEEFKSTEASMEQPDCDGRT